MPTNKSLEEIIREWYLKRHPLTPLTIVEKDASALAEAIRKEKCVRDHEYCNPEVEGGCICPMEWHEHNPNRCYHDDCGVAKEES